ncbi:sugar lactone lactonase YvrE [Saccharomonospora amisosensis]|uniref:Sugar lactone lactonase YvrE n=1 Tax=Saccharomonospora amisosensis TaxID=1128677 RepID=A0A7X5US23_9PSEU|nr:SMP-30/gluconolactonase/LRE family protein [Saccharomonospora amisosensis]NIJ13128.1 sugar lactone lactonase YvrE [Saccharomonospora amisosensis]
MGFGEVRTIPVNGVGPEDVLVDSLGRVYTGLEDGRIIRVDDEGRRIDTVADTEGRPLGLEFLGEDELVVCDAVRGLLSVRLSDGAVRTLVVEAAGQRLTFCNNAAVDSEGTVYFTDSSTRFGIGNWRDDLIEQTGTGRLLRRTPDGVVDVLTAGLQFANGVALAPDESFVAVAETSACRVRRVWLDPRRHGATDLLVDELPGFCDNISTGSDGLIWVTQASPKVASLELVRRLPAALRRVVRGLPTSLQPSPRPTCGVLGVSAEGEIVHDIGGEIEGFRLLTGVREMAGSLYFGSLEGNRIVVTEVAAAARR